MFLQQITSLVRDKIRREALHPNSGSSPQEKKLNIQQKRLTNTDTNNNSKSNNGTVPHLTSTSENTTDIRRGSQSYNCWLCTRRAAFLLEDKKEIVLCFRCFRAAFCAFALPLIDTPKRRESDVHFIAKIQRLKEYEASIPNPPSPSSNANNNNNNTSSKGCKNNTNNTNHSNSNSGSGANNYGRRSPDGDTVTVTSATEASFCLRGSINWSGTGRRSEIMTGRVATNNNNNNNNKSTTTTTTTTTKNTNNNNNNHNSGDAGSMDVDFWTCPRCTFENPSDFPLCGACGLRTTGVVQCADCGLPCRMDDSRLTQCPARHALHIVWCCRVCEAVQALDADRCCVCGSPVMWACNRCTMVQASMHGSDGLRRCRECGAYATPLEVIRSNPDIDNHHYSTSSSSISGIGISGGGNNNNNNDNRTRRTGGECGSQGVIMDHPTHTHTHTTHNTNTNTNTIPFMGEEVEEFGVNDAVTLAEMSRQHALAQADTRLARRIKELGVVQLNSQVSDGNCLFRALASQLFVQSGAHALVRSLIVEYMREYADSYRVLFDGENEWLSYLHKMRQNGCWGDELCLHAAARCFYVNIHVITSEDRRWHLVFQCDELPSSSSFSFPSSQSITRKEEEEDEKKGKRDGMERVIGEGYGRTSSTKSIKVSPTTTSLNSKALRESSSAPSYTQQEKEREKEREGEKAKKQNRVCLFLAYKAPVHYDDIMLPQVNKINDLKGLLKNELIKLVEEERSWCDAREEVESLPQLHAYAQIHPVPPSGRWEGAKRREKDETTSSFFRQQSQQQQQQQQSSLLSLSRSQQQQQQSQQQRQPPPPTSLPTRKASPRSMSRN